MLKPKTANCRTNSYAVDKRQGIALVVVLGFLAVLTIMAVGMAISMRTERLASKSYLDMVKARLYCESALADSMVWVEENLATQWAEKGERWNENVGNWGDFIIAPLFKETSGFNRWGSGEDWSVLFGGMLPSRDPANGGDSFTNSLVSGVGTNFLPYIPRRYYQELPENPDDVEKMGAEWIHITNNVTGGIEGRYMYLIFEVASFLDVNYQQREIVPGFRSAGDWDMFAGTSPEAVYRMRADSHIRYETVRDFFDSHGLDYLSMGGGSDVDSSYFSYAPPMKRIEVVREGDLNKVRFVEDLNGSSEMIYLPPDASDFSSQKISIENAFELGIRDFDQYRSKYGLKPSDMYELLVDFVDDDRRPEGNNFKRPSIEAVPMVNEVYVQASNVTVEVWAPFVGPERFTGSFDVAVEYEGVTSKASGNITAGADTQPPDPVQVQVKMSSAITNATANIVVSVKDGGTELDQVDFEDFGGITVGEYWECNDPRFNHHDSQWKKYASGSMGAINTRTAKYADQGNGRSDGDYLMYCADRPLISVGELGYLPIGPWRTIKLYEDPRGPQDMDPVLNYFTMQTNVVYGLLNPNTSAHMGRSISAIFDPRNQVEGGYLGLYHDDTYDAGADPKFLHRNVVSGNPHAHGMRIARHHFWDNRPSKNPADFGKKVYVNPLHGYGLNLEAVFRNFKNNTNPQYSELRLEHLMRRASALATVRQNMFLVCLWGQQLGSGEGEDWSTYPVKSEAQAVALVWRDPYPISDDDQRHRKFVRYMRWME